MGKGNGGKTVEVYVGAPYNFVPFAKKPYALEPETQVPHNTFAEERMDGEIRYRKQQKHRYLSVTDLKNQMGKRIRILREISMVSMRFRVIRCEALCGITCRFSVNPVLLRMWMITG